MCVISDPQTFLRWPYIMCVLLVTHDTFKVQITGSIGVLGDGVGVDFQCVHVVSVAGNHHVVPLVVVQRLVWVAFHQRRSIAQVEDVVDIPERAMQVSVYFQMICFFFVCFDSLNCVLISHGFYTGLASNISLKNSLEILSKKAV